MEAFETVRLRGKFEYSSKYNSVSYILLCFLVVPQFIVRKDARIGNQIVLMSSQEVA